MSEQQIMTLEENINIPVLPLRDVVVYPHMVIPLFVGREKSINALEKAVNTDKKILLVAQRNATEDDPTQEDLFSVGTVGTILQLLKLPDATVKVLVEGSQRGVITQMHLAEDASLNAQIDIFDVPEMESREAEVLSRSLMSQFESYVKLNKKVPPEILTSLAGITEPSRLADTIAAHMALKIGDKQAILEILSVKERIERLMALMETEIDLLQVEKKIRNNVKKQMEKSQREYYLNEQKKAIEKELGELEGVPNELEDLTNKIESSGMSKEAKTKAMAELHKLKLMSPMSAEATVSRNYLDWIVNIPWKKRSKVNKNLLKAEEVLEAEHYGLEEVKERILEYLAVHQRVKKLRGPVLCLVGPPGVGKTSLGESIAHATGRPFVRMALGGVRDEAEIRGHRRTYIGSMPGKILQKMSKAGVRNPLFLLDEVDKMAMDFRGDPASALLEVLDPEQNHTFNDHYLEVDYDLSDVMFVATANSLNIPGPLLDRMEVIRIPGYTEDEKLNISTRHLLPKQLELHGLTNENLQLTDATILDMIRYYTREAGVRNMEREISKISRKIVREILLKSTKRTSAKKKKASSAESAEEKFLLNPEDIEKYLGVKRFRFGLAEEHDQIGQVNGLGWTEVGGELLSIEAAIVQGKGKAVFTGRLGDVMQESIKAAMTVVRSRGRSLGLATDFYEKNDIHIHAPEGAIPKDGPSAGIGMCTALVSALTKVPVRADVAMTGEITLRGEVLPIGGLKEKLLAAHRGGIRTVIIPEENRRNLKDIPENILTDLDVRPVRWIDEVLALALQYMPEPLVEEEASAPLKSKKTRAPKANKGKGAATH